jgi:archaellum biogenesis ATPase FlaH
VEPFSQPAWVEESGQPYPGADSVAELIDQVQERQEVEAQAKIETKRALARKKGQVLAEAESDSLREIVIRKASSITPKRVRWLWAPGDEQKGRIPLGELCLIAGRGSLGKSTLLAEFTAWITKGEMRGEFYGTPKDVMYVANEDSLEYTVVPRLLAAGADLDRVHFVGINMLGRQDKVILPSDCDGLAEFAKGNNVAAIMLDPMSSNMRAKQNAAEEIRPVMERVRRMAEESDTAVIALAHTRKAGGTNLLDSIMGSSELSNVCRAAMGVALDGDSEDRTKILSMEKNNLGDADIDSYKYQTVGATIWAGNELLSTSRIEWLGRTPMTASDVYSETLTAGPSSRSAVAEAADFIRDVLTPLGGQALRGEVLKATRAEGIADKTAERAAKRLGIESKASGQGAKRLWVMPPRPPN